MLAFWSYVKRKKKVRVGGVVSFNGLKTFCIKDYLCQTGCFVWCNGHKEVRLVLEEGCVEGGRTVKKERPQVEFPVCHLRVVELRHLHTLSSSTMFST